MMLFGKNTIYKCMDVQKINSKLCTHIFTVNDDIQKFYYQGEILNKEGEPNPIWDGYGKLWTTIFTYNGDFKNGLPDGKGIYKYVGDTNNLNNEFVKYYDGEFKDGMKHGYGLEIYINNESYKGTFNKSLKHGDGIYYSSNGSEKIKGQWDMGFAKDTTSIIEYWENGNIKYKGGFNGNKWDGKGVVCYPNNDICFEGIFSNGSAIKGSLKDDKGIRIFEGSLNNSGFCTIYYSSGNRFIEYTLTDDIYYKIKQYDSNGKIHFDGYILNKDNIFNLGEIDIIKLTDHIKSIFNNIKYISGKFYYDSSSINSPKIKSECEFDENQEYNNEYREYFDNGILHIHTFYKNGVEDGFYKTFTENGNLKIDAMKKNNIFVGEYKEYDDNNNKIIIKQGIYENGILTNAIIKNNEDKLIYEGDIDKDNKYIGTGKLYYNNESNSLRYEGEFVNNKFSGSGWEYYKNNNFKYQGDWLNNKKHGQGTSYYEATGMMEYVGDWVHNEKHGSGTLFNENGEQVWVGSFHYNEIQMHELSDDGEED